MLNWNSVKGTIEPQDLLPDVLAGDSIPKNNRENLFFEIIQGY